MLCAAHVHGWTGERDVAKAIGNALADYRSKSAKAIWGMSIMVASCGLHDV